VKHEKIRFAASLADHNRSLYWYFQEEAGIKAVLLFIALLLLSVLRWYFCTQNGVHLGAADRCRWPEENRAPEENEAERRAEERYENDTRQNGAAL
jgi:hypothetical protein